MPDLPPEQLARQQIDAQLTACGWVVQDYKQFNPGDGRGIAADIIADLEAALDQFRAIEEDLR